MAVGDRIKRVRNFRGMTMKELGMAVGFDEKSADVRIAQYENNSRKPKEELMRKIAAALDVSVAYLEDPMMNDAEGILHSLSWTTSTHGCTLSKPSITRMPICRISVWRSALITIFLTASWLSGCSASSSSGAGRSPARNIRNGS